MNSSPPRHRPHILAIGYACYDLTFSVACHPGADEKTTAQEFAGCGGGLAANAAAAAGCLGYDVILAAYLGHDVFGNAHVSELEALGVNTRYLLRAEAPTGVSGILVKPDGQRTLAAFRGSQPQYGSQDITLATIRPRAVLVDGFQMELAQAVLAQARAQGIPTVLDADSASPDTLRLARNVDHLVGSERFAHDASGRGTIAEALAFLAAWAPAVVITRGARGLVWARQGEMGTLSAYNVPVQDTNGAGDAFHGAYAGGLAENMDWAHLLRYASATAALCCMTMGSRNGLPRRADVESLMARQSLSTDTGSDNQET